MGAQAPGEYDPKHRRDGLTQLVGVRRLESDEVAKLRQVWLPPPDGTDHIESLDQLWAAVGHFGLTEVAKAADLDSVRLREALADLALEEVERSSSSLRRSLERWKKRWLWRLAGILLLGILGAGVLYLETRPPAEEPETPTQRVVLTLPATPEGVVEAHPGEQVSLLLTVPPEVAVASTSLPGFLEDVLLLEVRSAPSPALVVAIPVEFLRKLAPLPAGLQATVVRPPAAAGETPSDSDPEL